MKKLTIVLCLILFAMASVPQIVLADFWREKQLLQIELKSIVAVGYLAGKKMANINYCNEIGEEFKKTNQWKCDLLEVDAAVYSSTLVYACRIGYFDKLFDKQRLDWMMRAIDDTVGRIPSGKY
jgi:hypothetical protein